MEHNFYALNYVVSKHLVGLGRLVELHMARDHKSRGDITALYPGKQRSKVALNMCLSCSNRESAIHDGAHRNLIDPSPIDTRNRYCATAAVFWAFSPRQLSYLQSLVIFWSFWEWNCLQYPKE